MKVVISTLKDTLIKQEKALSENEQQKYSQSLEISQLKGEETYQKNEKERLDKELTMLKEGINMYKEEITKKFKNLMDENDKLKLKVEEAQGKETKLNEILEEKDQFIEMFKEKFGQTRDL